MRIHFEFSVMLLSFAFCCRSFELRSFAEDLINVPLGTFRNVSEIISSRGYPVKDYTVQTPDGYLLSVQRISLGKTDSGSSDKPPVLLLHGFLSSSAQWVFNNRSQSLGFFLADQGYDVWLGNVRGNTYTRRNIYLSPSQNEFWDFSYDEFAKYDLPSMIDFILSKTGKKQINYIGHSQGSTIALALLSKSPEYNKKIKLFIAMAPVAQATNLGGLIGLFMPLVQALQPFYKEIGLVELLPHCRIFEFISVFVCGTSLDFLCADVAFATFGTDKVQLNNTRLPVYVNHFPAGTSFKDYIHYAQNKFSGKFRMYDYGDRNNEVYGQDTPPLYDLSKITTPTVIMSGHHDIIAPPEDVAKIQSEMRSVVESYVIPFELFSHGDFLYAIDAYELLNKKVLSVLKNYG